MRPNTPSMMPSIIAASLLLWTVLPYGKAQASTSGLQIPNVPLVIGEGTAVKPNVAVVFDDSHSMASQNMPGHGDDDREEVCWGWYKHNILAYNPNVRYIPPYKPDGAPYSGNVLYPDDLPRYPDAVSLSALEAALASDPTSVDLRALKDGYFPAGERTFIAGAFINRTGNLNRPPFGDDNIEDDDDLDEEDEDDFDDELDDDDDDDDDDEENFYYTIPRNANLDPKKCADDDVDDEDFILVRNKSRIAAPGVPMGSARAWVNYANWYSYYRRRAYAMKAALGEAFKSADESYRVGLYFINSHRERSRNTDLPLAYFDDSQAADWYSTLYGSKRNGGTPLRGALSRIGRMYTGKTDTDPVQYSCQRNVTILATDGYWNAIGESSTYGPLNVDATARVGDVDGAASVPYKDGHRQHNTLSDVAYYYYTTDLRTEDLENCANANDAESPNLCTNNVPGSGKDKNNQQHMTTYAMGLGVGGNVLYEPNYETAPDVSRVLQYFDIVNSNGRVRWPEVDMDDLDEPEDVDPAKIDDVWHAAVNGRGRYYSTAEPTSLYKGVQAALSGLRGMRGSSSAAATSSLRPVPGDNAVYVAYYDSTKWHGDVKAFSFDLATRTVTTTAAWSAQQQLDQQAASPSGRTIYFLKNPATKLLATFNFSNLDTADQAYFTNICSKPSPPAQCADWPVDDVRRTKANTGANLVNYLRGSAAHEEELANTYDNRLYRERDHILGDIIHGAPVYVKKPPFSYSDPTYVDFKNAQNARGATLYVAANDGMLHAFNADTGQERWAYVPKFVMPHMWELADRNYSHRYFVDGAPTVADICVQQSVSDPQMCAGAEHWKTILVGGLNKGGCGYYALDITNPAVAPKGMWEFTDNDLGYSFGNPVIAKNKNGKWVVMFTSGYNNHTGPRSCKDSGDGNGHVFVLEAQTGELLREGSATVGKISLPPGPAPADGETAEPVGLGKLNAWIDDPSNPVAKRLYGGDLNGRLWRIDFDDNYGAAGREATLLAHLKDGDNIPQPITTRPELAFYRVASPDGTPVVMVGTGKLLEPADLNNTTQRQSLYAIKDSLETSGVANVRDETRMVRLTLTETIGEAGGALEGRIIRKVSGGPVDWAEHDGWYVDFNPNNKSPGERVNVDMEFQSGILTLATNVPETDPCSVGGYSFYYFFNVKNARHASKAPEQMVGVRASSNAMTAGIGVVKLPDGGSVVIGNRLDGEPPDTEDVPGEDGETQLRRTAWRELID